MDVTRQHGLDPMSPDLCQVGVINARGVKMTDIGVTGLKGADIKAGDFWVGVHTSRQKFRSRQIRPLGVVKISSQSGPFRLTPRARLRPEALSPIDRDEQTTEGAGFPDRCLRVLQGFGMPEVQLDPVEPTEQLASEDPDLGIG
jgi:hypothetical protein